MQNYRPDLQIIFQDPGQSLNPRQTVFTCLAEAVNVRGKLLKKECLERIDSLMDQVKLPKSILSSLPSQLSGGQKQRVAIARVLALDPKLIIADEPTSSLDAPFKQEILELLRELRRERNLTLILITHDLRVAAQMTDRLVILYKGRIVEYGNTSDIINSPLHPYTRLLLSVVRSGNTENYINEKYYPVSSPDNGLSKTGCSYYPDCPIKDKNCQVNVPRLKLHKSYVQVACHLVADVKDNLPDN
jgi:peptide/nickel transport system ATP-binding protein/oligopeptide transport system ATP-binding protein